MGESVFMLAAAVVTALSAAASAAYTISGSAKPKTPDFASLKPRDPLPTPPPPPVPPKMAPDKSLEEADQKSRQKAAQAFRDLERRSSGASTVLTSPLGVSTPPGNVSSTVLGR